jgi:hypothetical protein
LPDDQLGSRFHVSLRKLVAASNERGELVQDFLRAGDISRIPFDHELVAIGPDSHAKQVLEVFEVFVVAAEERLDTLVGHCNLANDCCRRDKS